MNNDEVLFEEFLEAKDNFICAMGAKDVARFGIKAYQEKFKELQDIDLGLLSVFVYLNDQIEQRKRTVSATYELVYGKQLPEDNHDALEILTKTTSKVSEKLKNQVVLEFEKAKQ